mgnify:CR=1 FL=1
MTGRLLPQPDDLYCFLAYAFAASGKARSHIVGTTDSLDQDACATLERLVPTLGCARPGHCVDLLFGVLWEVSDGDWQRAQGMLAEVGRPRREDVLRQLASSMARVVGDVIDTPKMRLKSVNPLLPPKPVSLRKKSSIAA